MVLSLTLHFRPISLRRPNHVTSAPGDRAAERFSHDKAVTHVTIWWKDIFLFTTYHFLQQRAKGCREDQLPDVHRGILSCQLCQSFICLRSSRLIVSVWRSRHANFRSRTTRNPHNKQRRHAESLLLSPWQRMPLLNFSLPKCSTRSAFPGSVGGPSSKLERLRIGS